MNKILCKLLLAVPLVLFADWIIMILAGCFFGACNASDKFFCTVYCYFGIILVAVSLLLTFYFVFRKKHMKFI